MVAWEISQRIKRMTIRPQSAVRRKTMLDVGATLVVAREKLVGSGYPYPVPKEVKRIYGGMKPPLCVAEP
jgi:hypothetical protein